MSEVHRYSVVKMLSEAGNKISYDPHGPEVVMAKDYDALAAEAQVLREEVAKLTQYNKSLNEENTRLLVDCEETDKEVVVLRTKLAMAEDAAAKGDAARHQCGGMEMEIEELRAELATLRARVVVVPERKLLNAGVPGLNRNSGWNACLYELARINGMTVSEGLLRRLLDSDGIDGIFDAQQNYAAHQELRALLSEQDGGGQ
ncbi:TPA: hypothetical protein L4H08_005501 [Pseudomonas aeruginosa]|nr:hypothetical protein [Pseudomonas aeruginosa]